MALNPLRHFTEPLVVGLGLAVVGVALASPPLGVLGGGVLAVLGTRVAYDHRGAGRYLVPTSVGPPWLRRQLTGALLFYVALALVVGSLRHVGVG